jgi:CheY-like chemotaxis protein
VPDNGIGIDPQYKEKSLAYSSGSIMTGPTAVPASGWLFASAWLNVTEEESGSNPNLGKEQRSTSPEALLVREAIRIENLPWGVRVAPEGQKAVEFIARAETDPDAPSPQFLLLDLNLPKVDGFEVLRRLRASAKFKDVPVLIASSSDAPRDRSRAAEFGAGYFRKPPSYDEFLKLGGVLKQLLKDNSGR